MRSGINALQRRIEKLVISSSLFHPKSSVVVGVSGGADSISLLHILSNLFPATRRIAVYIDHGLRPLETEAEKKLVREQAMACSAHFESLTVDVAGEQKAKGCSLEEAARELRYQTLETLRVAHGASAIAVGHTADDQAEEVLLRLIRGSGSRGLSGMDLHHGHIVRPLLHETKDTLLSYLKERNIPYCLDSSNFDRRFLRNRIRLDLLPKIENEYNQAVRQTLLQTATILNDEDKLLDKMTAIAYQSVVVNKKDMLSLSLTGFLQQPIAIQRRILDRICWTLGSKPSYKKIKSLLALAASETRKEIHLSNGLRAVRETEIIRFHRPSLQNGYRGPGIIRRSFSPITIHSPGVFPIEELGHTLHIQSLPFSPALLATPDTLFLDADLIQFPLSVRHIKEGECFQPLGAPGRKKLSRFLSDHKIPIMERDKYPLILSKDTILALVGLRIDHNFRIRKQTKQVLALQWLTS